MVIFVILGLAIIVFRNALTELWARWMLFPFSRERPSQGYVDATRFVLAVIGVLCILIGLGEMVGP